MSFQAAEALPVVSQYTPHTLRQRTTGFECTIELFFYVNTRPRHNRGDSGYQTQHDVIIRTESRPTLTLLGRFPTLTDKKGKRSSQVCLTSPRLGDTATPLKQLSI